MSQAEYAVQWQSISPAKFDPPQKKEQTNKAYPAFGRTNNEREDFFLPWPAEDTVTLTHTH